MTNLIIARLEQTAGLGVEPLIPVPISIESIALHASKSGGIPLHSPVHSGIRNQKRRRHVQNLVTEATEGVEDGRMKGTGHRTLAVSGEGVGGDPLGDGAA